MRISWAYKTFSELKNTELYEILVLRQKVFIVEQQEIYLDADRKDLHAMHLVGYDDDADKKIIAYARIIFPDVDNKQQNTTSFGRVIVDKTYRRKGLAKTLIQHILKYLQSSDDGKYPIKISAQKYLVDFYKSFGFETLGEIYLDGTIEHIDMMKRS